MMENGGNNGTGNGNLRASHESGGKRDLSLCRRYVAPVRRECDIAAT